MALQLDHLFNHPSLVPVVAAAIYDEFWRDRPGYSPEFFAHLLRQASQPSAIPLCRIALLDGEYAGTVNLIENDDEHRRHLRPWLAALVVRADRRGRGIGRALVQRLLADARALGERELYLGTDAPEFYRKLGAELFIRTDRPIQVMRFDLAAPPAR